MEPGVNPQLYKQIEELFRNAMSLSSLTAYISSNCDWFISNLLFERVAINWLVIYSMGTGNDDNNNDDKSNKSSERVFRAKKSEYKEEE